MKDYQSIWVKWIALCSTDQKTRRELLEKFNIEVTKGFDVITKIASDEIAHQTQDFQEYESELEVILAFLVYSGYILFLIQENVDPEKENLIAKTSTAELGNKWMESFEKDKGIDLIEKIDPILFLMMEEQKKLYLDSFLQKNAALLSSKFQSIQLIELYFLWAVEQGYIFGMLEKELAN